MNPARAGNWPVDGGLVEIHAVPGTRDEWVLRLDGIDQSHVDLADPTHLAFEYVRWIGSVMDLAADPGEPLDTVHIGAGAGTLPRYLSATRPGSRQVVLDPDEALLSVARDRLDLRSTPTMRVRCADGRVGLAAAAADRYDMVVRDAFTAMAVPAHLATLEFMRDVGRVLRPGGWYVANLSDRTPFEVMRAEAATALAVWDEVWVVAEPGTWRGRRTGNMVVIASNNSADESNLRRRLSGGSAPARLVTTEQVRSRVGRRPPLVDGVTGPEAPHRPTWV